MATTGVQQATLTVWKFPTATGAAEAVKTVKTLQQERLNQMRRIGTLTEAEFARAKRDVLNGAD